MANNNAEIYLLERVRKGDNDAWNRLVGRFQGRLLSFARAKLAQPADAEDLVQDTFIAFIKGITNFRHDSPVESYLFAILRRKIANTYRSSRAGNITLIEDTYGKQARRFDSDVFSNIPGTDQTASWYARKDEDQDLRQQALSKALDQLIDNYKSTLNFRDLQIIEMLFYCQLSNSEVADIMNIDSKNIGVIKHRCIRHVRDQIRITGLQTDHSDLDFECTLTSVWESARPSCPKRSTIGAFLLGTLDDEWHGYVDFHINRIGCHFCRANFEDLKEQTKETESSKLQTRILESTIGFLHKRNG